MWPEAERHRNLAGGLLIFRCVSLALLLLIFVPGTGVLAIDRDSVTAYDAAQDAVAQENYKWAETLLAEWLATHTDDAPARFLRIRIKVSVLSYLVSARTKTPIFT